ncbi:HAD family phosphatase [Lentzea sp. NBRC 102530]|uniref:HAD family hydrolase n=1 Tax=Lentzea sp. NBRC 102530 TaxID=3032201 RepID=UPI0024A2BE78|nr:HAD family phosphatase [Lentzea sp. NBRC 102530]GLY48046.1 hydrolase [Lentzea sp. NBRC 102530]
MSGCTEPSTNPEKIKAVLSDAEILMLDFDGPICSVFAALPAYVVADQLREILESGGHTRFPAEIRASSDPFDVFAYAASKGSKEAKFIEAALRAHEVEAVVNAEPTDGALDLIQAWNSTGRRISIVSNNSAEAVEVYLERFGLRDQVQLVSARESPDPALLKPAPFLIRNAAEKLGVSSESCVLIGDSASDIEATLSAGAVPIGYANKPGKAKVFRDRYSTLITYSITSLVELLKPA